MDSYFEYAFNLPEKSSDALQQGQLDSSYGDSYGLVTVIYAVVLLLLGIVGTPSSYKNGWLLFVLLASRL